MDVERLKESLDIFTSCVTIRGGIIDYAVWIENTLTDIIAWCCYPTSGRLDEDFNNQLDENGIILKSLILTKLEFHEKIEILKPLISIKNKDVWNNNLELMKNISKDLNKVREFRNLLAHSPIDTSREAFDAWDKCKGVEFRPFQVLDYKKGRVKPHTIDNEEIGTQLRIAVRAFFRLLQLWALLKSDPEDAQTCENMAMLTDMELNKELEMIMKHLGVAT